MKLITEHLEDNLSYITEEKNGKKNTVIEGIFMQADLKIEMAVSILVM